MLRLFGLSLGCDWPSWASHQAQSWDSPRFFWRFWPGPSQYRRLSTNRRCPVWRTCLALRSVSWSLRRRLSTSSTFGSQTSVDALSCRDLFSYPKMFRFKLVVRPWLPTRLLDFHRKGFVYLLDLLQSDIFWRLAMLVDWLPLFGTHFPVRGDKGREVWWWHGSV